jgi:cation diffusion facilitator family transporter
MGENQHHYTSAATNSGDERYRQSHRVTVVGAAINLVLSVIKVWFGWIGQSHALIADGIHSLSDLLSDAMVLLAAKHGSAEADEEHPYGHGRIETLATVVLGGLLILVAVGIGWDAIRRLFDETLLLSPGALALAVAVVSVLAKEALYHYTLAVARRIRSKLLQANAWHHRSDAVSSVVVVVGVIGTMAGLSYLDAIASVIVAVMIARIGWELSWHAVQELIDTALDADKVEQIRGVIAGVSGVRALHMLRTRRMGADALVDVHIQVDPRVSVSEGHQISETVRTRLIEEVEEVTDVTVHIDAEDDEQAPVRSDLPSREKLLAELKDCLATTLEGVEIQDVTLHYLGGRIHLDIILPLEMAKDVEHARAIAEELKRQACILDSVGAVEVSFR